MTKRGCPTKEEVAAMIAAAGGGGGANIKSGLSIGLATEITQVDFATPFATIPNIVLSPVQLVITKFPITEVTVSFFKWKNPYTADYTIHWIATTAGN